MARCRNREDTNTQKERRSKSRARWYEKRVINYLVKGRKVKAGDIGVLNRQFPRVSYFVGVSGCWPGKGTQSAGKRRWQSETMTAIFDGRLTGATGELAVNPCLRATAANHRRCCGTCCFNWSLPSHGWTEALWVTELSIRVFGDPDPPLAPPFCPRTRESRDMPRARILVLNVFPFFLAACRRMQQA